MPQILKNKIDRLSNDELQIVDRIVTRLLQGKRTYGNWQVKTDKRKYASEALEEVMDALNYSAAQLVKLEQVALEFPAYEV